MQNFGTRATCWSACHWRDRRRQAEQVVGRVFAGMCSAEAQTCRQRADHHRQGRVGPAGRRVRPAGRRAGHAQARTEFVAPRSAPNWRATALALGGGDRHHAYLAVRFEWKFSVAGIVANLHDVVIILGFFAFFQWEFSLAVLAAVLAVLGYSVNESVVIFDRVREAFRKVPQDELARGDRPRHHQHHQPHHHHPRLHADDGAVDATSSAAPRCTTSRWR